jgi:hypothetical protein
MLRCLVSSPFYHRRLAAGGMLVVAVAAGLVLRPDPAAFRQRAVRTAADGGGLRSIPAGLRADFPYYEARIGRDGFEETGVRPYFSRRGCYRVAALDFGLGEAQLDALADHVCRVMYQDPAVAHVQGRSVASTAVMIRDRTDRLLQELGVTAPPDARAWLLAEAVCAWTLGRCYYDKSQLKSHAPAYPARRLLAMRKPHGLCRDLAQLTCELATALGLRCEGVTGPCWWIQDAVAGRPGGLHRWVEFTLRDGDQVWRVPADVTTPITDPAHRPDRTRKWEPWVTLPRTPEGLELFLATHHQPGDGEKAGDPWWRKAGAQRRGLAPLLDWYAQLYGGGPLSLPYLARQEPPLQRLLPGARVGTAARQAAVLPPVGPDDFREEICHALP